MPIIPPDEDATSVSSKITPEDASLAMLRIGRRKRLRQRRSGRQRGHSSRYWRGDSRGATTGDTGGYSRAEEQHASAVDEEVVGGDQQGLLVGQLHQNRTVGELNVGNHVSGAGAKPAGA